MMVVIVLNNEELDDTYSAFCAMFAKLDVLQEMFVFAQLGRTKAILECKPPSNTHRACPVLGRPQTLNNP
jgi:hypothetical protein